jgi:glycosyltransferase involved in cell wall biosynthesis
MRVLLVADGRSPITRRWVRLAQRLGHDVVLVSTFPCAPLDGVEADVCLPVAFAALGGSVAGAGVAPVRRGAARRVISAFRPLFLAGRYRLGPLTLRYYGPRLRWLVERIQPDLVHALRIPYEGMLAAWTPPGVPLALSIWGNDLTLHAAGSRAMAALTRGALTRADALFADAQRDVRLARAWGLAANRPALVVPGAGGLDLAELDAARAKVRRWGSSFEPQVGAGSPLVVNPRGFRTGSVRQDTFFQALPLVLQRRPDARFACAAMAGQREALGWVERLGLGEQVILLPHLPQDDLWDLLARAEVTVSVSQHDGTPNSLLEAMALGAFPVAGDIESLREWITPGVNGLLVEPDKPQALAEAILLALDSPDLRLAAAEHNRRLVEERAAAGVVQEQVRLFYEMLGGMKDVPHEA